MATGVPKTKWNGNLKNFHECKLPTGDGISLSYEGKTAEKDILAIEPVEVLLLWTNEKVKGENLNRLYYGDNMLILANLLNENEVRGKVRLVYIDPPFATKSVFQSRSQVDAYSDILAGANYIEFLRKRLVLLRELLAEDGSIYVHLDENMAFHIKVIMDEVFGPRNFRNWVTRKKCNPKNYTKKSYGNVSDFILFYTKSDNYVWNRPMEIWTEDRAEKEYQYLEEGTKRRYKKVPIHAPGIRNGETGKPWRGMNPPPGKHWQFPPDTLEEMDARGEIYWSPNGNPRRKIYLDESEGVPIQDIWLDFRDAHNQNIKITGYPTEKNPDLLARIIQASSNPGDLVLDCFSGSGTSLAVASQLERRWIGIDNSSEAIVTNLRRFARGCERMGEFVKQRQNKKNDDLPLYDFDESSEPEINNIEPQKVIRNFSLYAIHPYNKELDSGIAQWLGESG